MLCVDAGIEMAKPCYGVPAHRKTVGLLLGLQAELSSYTYRTFFGKHVLAPVL